jgi:hypothetical protein
LCLCLLVALFGQPLNLAIDHSLAKILCRHIVLLVLWLLVYYRYPGWSRQPCELLRSNRRWYGSSHWLLGQLPANLELKCLYVSPILSITYTRRSHARQQKESKAKQALVSTEREFNLSLFSIIASILSSSLITMWPKKKKKSYKFFYIILQYYAELMGGFINNVFYWKKS